jgi:hypothetical protein
MLRLTIAQPVVVVLIAFLQIAMVALPAADATCAPATEAETCPCCDEGCCCRVEDAPAPETPPCSSCRAATPMIAQAVRPVMPDVHDSIVIAVLPVVSEMPLPQCSTRQPRIRPPDPGPARRACGTQSTVLLL